MPGDDAMVDVQQNGRRRLTGIANLILRAFAVAVFSAAVSAATAILVHPPAIGSQVYVPNSAAERLPINVPDSRLEQTAAGDSPPRLGDTVTACVIANP